jgi:hypothetical protein
MIKTNTENLVWKKNLETQLQYEHDKTILSEKARLNEIKNLKSLEYTAKIQENLEPFEKELSSVIELLSTARARANVELVSLQAQPHTLRRRGF